MKNIRLFTYVATILFSIQLSGQNQITLYPDIDAKISSAYPTTNYATDTTFTSGSITNPAEIIRSLIKFDLSSIPSNAIIGNATLTLYGLNHYGAANSSKLSVISSTWTESSVTWSNQPSTAKSSVSLSNSSYSTEDYYANVTNILKLLVGAEATSINYGFLLKLTLESGDNKLCFASSDHSNPSKHPTLVIQYTVPSEITIYPTKDAEVNSGSASTNYGNSAYLFAEAWSSGVAYYKRAYLEMDLSSIPANSIVAKADLNLFWNGSTSYYHSTSNSASYLQRVTASWSENTITWTNKAASTTTGQLTIPAATSQTQDYTINMTTMVKDWYNQTYSNYGFVIKLATEAVYRRLAFASSDHLTTSKRPSV
jgi:hypothetical protein